MSKFKVLAPFTVPILIPNQEPRKKVLQMGAVIDLNDKSTGITLTKTEITDLTERKFLKEFDPNAQKSVTEMSEMEIGEILSAKNISIEGVKNRKELEQKYNQAMKSGSGK